MAEKSTVDEKLRIARAALLVGAQFLNEAERLWQEENAGPNREINPAQAQWERRRGHG